MLRIWLNGLAFAVLAANAGKHGGLWIAAAAFTGLVWTANCVAYRTTHPLR